MVRDLMYGLLLAPMAVMVSFLVGIGKDAGEVGDAGRVRSMLTCSKKGLSQCKFKLAHTHDDVTLQSLGESDKYARSDDVFTRNRVHWVKA